MITRFITDISTKFNPFNVPAGKTVRNFLALLPPNARSTMKINAQMLPRTTTGPTTLLLKFKDGKEMNLDVDKLKIKDVIEQVDRHSRMLGRQDELGGN